MAYQPKSYRKFVATTATAAMVASAVAPVVSAAAGFTDVAPQYKDAIDFLVSTGATNGKTDTKFGVYDEITRLDAAVILAKVLKLDVDNAKDAGFTDVPKDRAKYVNALVEAGVLSGKAPGKFGAYDKLTRVEMAKIIANAYNLKGDDVTLPFTDVNDTWAPFVKALYKNGVTKGKTETSFGAYQNITRGDFAQFVYRAANVDVAPQVVSVSAINGTVTVKFDKELTEVTADDFKVTQKIGEGEAKEVTLSKVELGEDKKTVTITVPAVEVTKDDLNVTIGVAYKGGEEKTASFTVAGDKEAPVLSVADVPSTVSEEKLTVTGTVEGATKVTVNGQEVTVNEDGTFSAEVTLIEGDNTITIVAVDAVGNETKVEKTVKLDTKAKVESVTAVTSKSLKVTFSKPVDTTKAKFEVKKDGLKLNASTITFNEDKTAATIELASKLTKGEYTVTVTGLTDEALTKSVTVEDERVAKIEILSDVAIVDNTANPTQATVAYRVTNQYGEDITKTTSLITNDDNNIHLSNGVATINLAAGAKVGDKVPLTLINVDSAVSTTKVLTLSAAATVSDVEITGVYNKDGKTLNEDTDLSKDEFYLLVNVKDQYGNEITDANKAEAGLIKSQSNPTVVGTAGANTNVDLTSLTINGKTQLALKLTGPVKAGENLVTLISTATGKSATYKVTVAESTRSDVVTLSQPSLAVAKEDVLVPVTVLDKVGNTITDVKVLNNATKGVTVSLNGNSLPAPFVNNDGATYVKVPAAKLQTEGYYTLVAQSSTYKVATLTLNVKKAAEPKVVTGLDSKVRTALLAGQSQVITTGSILVEDQYGRTMTKEQLDAWLAADQNNVINISVLGQEDRFVLKQVNADGSDLQTADTPGTTKVLSKDNPAVQISAKSDASVGDQKIKFDLSGVAASAKEETFRVTSASEFVSYEVEPIGKVFDEAGAGLADNSAYDKQLKVYGVLSNGKKVLLTPNDDYTVRAENAQVDNDVADGTIDADNLSLNYAQNATEVVVPVTVTINATGQEFTQNVTFSKVKPTVASVKFVNANDATITSTTATEGVDFDETTLPQIVVTDSYGVEFDATNGVVTFTPADQANNIPAYTATPVLTFTTVDGQLTFANNGKVDAKVVGTSFGAGESFNVKVTYPGGANATLKVTGVEAAN